jgi:hypothetical protein
MKKATGKLFKRIIGFLNLSPYGDKIQELKYKNYAK